MTKSSRIQAVAMAAMVAAVVVGMAATSEAQVIRKRAVYMFEARPVARQRVLLADATPVSRRRTVYLAGAQQQISLLRRNWWIMRAHLGGQSL